MRRATAAVEDGVITRLSEVWPAIEQAAQSRGALRVGASPLEDSHAELFMDWLRRGHQAGMAYLDRNAAVRLSPREPYPWAQSVIVISVPYAAERCEDPGKLGSHIARYAAGDDYHFVLDDILGGIESDLQQAAAGVKTRRYVDTGPLSDRSYGAQAGIGWIGKNGMLIDPDHGSYFFIGTLLTSLRFDMAAEEVADRCGTCTRCIEACPTAAIQPDRTIASHACISYATIEHRGPIVDSMKESLGGNLFGCDICNEVCPWNGTFVPGIAPFAAREAYRATPVTDLLRLTQADFSHLFKNSAIKRAKRAGLVRNAILVANEIPADVQRLLEADPDEGVRDALAWRRRTRATSD